jgi:hypothetical protein
MMGGLATVLPECPTSPSSPYLLRKPLGRGGGASRITRGEQFSPGELSGVRAQTPTQQTTRKKKEKTSGAKKMRKIKIETDTIDNGYGTDITRTIVRCSKCNKILLSYYEAGTAISVAKQRECTHFMTILWGGLAEETHPEEYRKDLEKSLYRLQTPNGVIMVLPK